MYYDQSDGMSTLIIDTQIKSTHLAFFCVLSLPSSSKSSLPLCLACYVHNGPHCRVWCPRKTIWQLGLIIITSKPLGVLKSLPHLLVFYLSAVFSRKHSSFTMGFLMRSVPRLQQHHDGTLVNSPSPISNLTTTILVREQSISRLVFVHLVLVQITKR
jgi:hypothetical protein